MTANNEVTTREPADISAGSVPIASLIRQSETVQELMQHVLKDTIHYGVIPGTPKPSLWKAGADMLCMTFRLASSFKVLSCVQEEKFISYVMQCELRHIPTGEMIAAGVGACNTSESKYWKQTDKKGAFDLENTIIKMASKRAKIDATLAATGAATMFTQDLEPQAQRKTTKMSMGEK